MTLFQTRADDCQHCGIVIITKVLAARQILYRDVPTRPFLIPFIPKVVKSKVVYDTPS